MRHDRKKYKVAIDPGVVTGVAVMDNRTGRVLSVHSLDFWRAHDFVLMNYDPQEAELVVELPSTGAVYAGRLAAKNPTVAAGHRMAKDVGGVIKQAELLIERFEQKGFKVTACRPVKGGKWDQKEFELKTGLKVQTNEHTRDAARLLFFA